jgi:Nucleotidyl transferase AbiEii toxin, Type IV TA system
VITEADIAHWRNHVPWEDPQQVEQDLVLSRLIIEFACHPLLGNELVFRGGTCFHKLWLDRPWRYSEDLDYVRRTEGGIGDIFTAIREVADADRQVPEGAASIELRERSTPADQSRNEHLRTITGAANDDSKTGDRKSLVHRCR